MCLINDYSLIADLHIIVYGRAECASISLKCTNVKLLILNNFAFYPVDPDHLDTDPAENEGHSLTTLMTILMQT